MSYKANIESRIRYLFVIYDLHDQKIDNLVKDRNKVAKEIMQLDKRLKE